MGLFDSIFGGGGSDTTVQSDTKSDVNVDIEVAPEINVAPQLLISAPLVDNSLSSEMVEIEHRKINLAESQLKFEKESSEDTAEAIESTGNKIVVGLIVVILGAILTKRSE